MKNRLLICLALLFLTFVASAADAAVDKPNIIVILCDDLGWADLGAQGVQKDIRTPNLDLLAAGGLRATNAYVTAPQCVPSRAGLLSGRSQCRFGVEANRDSLEGFNAQETIASRLKKAGYATGMAGKWHLGPKPKIGTHGFDDVYSNDGRRGKAWANFDFDGKTIKGGTVTSSMYHLDANSAAACAFIERHKQQPFFFYLAYRAPHIPLDAPQKYLDRFPGEMPEPRRQCLGMMSAVDDGVGSVMETLRKNSLESNTLIFFLADNGAPLKMTKAAGWDGSINAPMNGEKGMLSEGGIREPWLAYWKDRIPAGQVYEHPVISYDIVSTAVALAGQPQDPALDGVNLLPFFTGKEKGAPHERIYWRWVDQAAVREGKWKLLVGGPRSYLFDLEADPGEKHNLLDDQPELAQQLHAKLDAWAKELKPPGVNTEVMEEVWEGYYDFYFDGKPASKQTDVEDTGGGNDEKKRRKQKVKDKGAVK
jgi:arylsulfatase A-like enzyme